MLKNYFHIATHTGSYGAGAAGVLTPAETWNNIMSLVPGAGTIFLFPTIYVLVVLVCWAWRRPLPASISRVLLACALIAVVAILLVAKQPRFYYLTSVVAFICLGNAVLFSCAFDKMRIPKWVAPVLAIPLMFRAYAIIFAQADLDSSDAPGDRRLIQTAVREKCALVHYYGAQDPQFNLYFGNLSTGGLYNDQLTRTYPDFLAYNTYFKEFQTYQELLPLDAVRKRFASAPCVYLVGQPWQMDFGIPARSLKLVERSRTGLSLYALASDWDASAYGKR
jgi:hypothetical protein